MFFPKRLVFWTIAIYLLLVGSALADSVQTNTDLTLQSKQTWTLLIGALVPLGTYVLNYIGPWVSDTTKALVTVLIAGISGGLYTALATTSFGWNSSTLQMVLTAVVAALGAHQFLWKPSGISTKLGAGRNAVRLHHLSLSWVPNRNPPPTPPTPIA